jgi:hypothetical protein
VPNFARVLYTRLLSHLRRGKHARCLGFFSHGLLESICIEKTRLFLYKSPRKKSYDVLNRRKFQGRLSSPVRVTLTSV